MTFLETLGLSVQVYEPRITLTPGTPNTVAVTPRGHYVALHGAQISAYSHTVAALGGFLDCSFSLGLPYDAVDAWIEGGLGRHVEVYDEAGGCVWEGFIDAVEVTVGGFSLVRGPLTDIGNRVKLVYSTVDTTTSPPTVGVRASTDWVEDTESQWRYGVWPKVLSTGGVSVALAEQLRDNYLAEHARPETTKRLNLSPGGAQGFTLSLRCKGYVARLDFPYEQKVTTGEGALSDKLAAILAAEPNGLFSGAEIAANALPVGLWEGQDRLGWDLIKALTAKGDASYRRHLFGVYAGRRAVYGPAPEEAEYVQRLGDPRQAISTVRGQRVLPWAVRAGRWIRFTDLLVGRFTGATVRDDPRSLFIESMTYTLPYTLTIEGGKVATIDQRLAQMGLAGMGV